MGSPFRSFSSGSSSSGLVTRGVKWLLVSNSAIFVFTLLAKAFLGWQFAALKLTPQDVFAGSLWQLVTYQFLHDVNGFQHILFNMASLFFVGPMLESAWGTLRFLRFYLLSGIGAGVLVCLASVPLGSLEQSTIGCSGSIFGLMIAYGVLFPNLLFFGAIPARYFVMIFGAISLLGAIALDGSRVSYVAHPGGLLTGWILSRTGMLQRLGGKPGAGWDPVASFRKQWKEWKLRRARKKFQVYMKRKSGRDPFDVQ